LRLLFAGQHRDALAANPLGCRDEFRPVHGVAASGRRHAPDLLDVSDIAERTETAQRIERLLDCIGG